MLDLKRIREDPDGVGDALARRDPALRAQLDELLAADREWRAATGSAESLRAEQKARSEAFGAARARGEDAPELRAEMQELSARVKAATEQAAGAKERVRRRSRACPTCPTRAPPTGPRTRSSRPSASRRASPSSRATTSSSPAR